jgi:cytochrome c-type biogenesis protein CcsB
MLRAEALLVQAALGLYTAAFVGYVLRLATGRQQAGKAATALAWLGLAAQSGMLVLRGVNARHAPLVTMYEYLSAFAWMVVLAYLVFERHPAGMAKGAQAAGGPALALAVGLLAYASTLPSHLKQAESLMPVLKSNWLVLHVSVAVIAYGAAGLASALACLYFISYRAQARWVRERLPAPADLDEAVYRAVRFAFPFLTLVNVTGAIWAYNAWGRYWGWDPKETWSLITWLIYVFYLHARLRAGWRAPQTNAVVVVGIGAILFTFLGVSQLAAFSDSLHSYASGG